MVDMTESDTEDDAPAPSKTKGLLVAALGALVAGGAGFFASYAGYLDGLLGSGGSDKPVIEDRDFAFVPLEPLMISLGPDARASTLRFTAELEVEVAYTDAVADLKPRVIDVLNGFLRAVDESELRDPAALELLRAQMLRRIQIVVGDGRVRDLLILEFIIN